MKINNVEIHPDNSSNFVLLSFRDPTMGLPYNVRAIQGLDADEIIARYYGVSENQNSRYYAMSMEKRDVAMLIELNPDFSVNESYSDLRDNLYRLIYASRTGRITVHFKEDNVVKAVVTGFFKKFEAGHFSKTPQVQMTIECDDPFMHAPDPVILNLSGLDPLNTKITDNVSTAPHGFLFDVKFTGAMDDFVITEPNDPLISRKNPGWKFSVSPPGGFEIGDVLRFCSGPRNRYLYIARSGTVIHLADSLLPGSVWPILFPGDNRIAIKQGNYLNWVGIWHWPTFWGV